MANKIKTNPELPIVFMPAGGTFPSGVNFPSGVRVTFEADSIVNGQGHISDEYDLGPGPRTSRFEWRLYAVPGAGSTIGTTLEVYLATSNSVAKDGYMPTTDSTLVYADKRRNLQYCGAAQVDSNDPMISAGVVEIFSRFISAVLWNNTNQSLDVGNYLVLTPIPDEIQ